MLNLFARLEQTTVLSLSSRAGDVFGLRVRVSRLISGATVVLRAAAVGLLLAGAASIAIAQESSAAATAEGAAQASSAASGADNSAELEKTQQPPKAQRTWYSQRLARVTAPNQKKLN
ncbi:MAG: hypothetical protein ABS26_09160 [OM182 bacterium BACL3 MAG-120531-bin86]|uniref:Uncharacterized protein n=1 Tax=OM182 bacterium BACL3 MAG-120531-bin86 TaxID=1655628 RepID=A0A0R2XRE9_9GAMM|nr:MAG: hypothetical protein ABS26_09160 [OM182 bacterium BACL3 MAG-120531-bin86]